MKITYNARLLAAVAVALEAKDNRYYLKGVYFTGALAVATDGHIMTVATDSNHTNPDDGVIMPVSKEAITAMSNDQADVAIFENDVLTVLDSQNEIIYLEPSKPIDGTYPEWEKLIPSETGDVCRAAFGYPVLNDLAQTRKILGNGIGIALTGADEFAPHRVRYTGIDNVYSIAMPIITGTP